MSKVVIKTPDGKYVGGGQEPAVVDRIERAYVYEDGPGVDAQLKAVNNAFNCGWVKVDAHEEYRRSRRKLRRE